MFDYGRESVLSNMLVVVEEAKHIAVLDLDTADVFGRQLCLPFLRNFGLEQRRELSDQRVVVLLSPLESGKSRLIAQVRAFNGAA